jgi:cytoskeletal protein CcmA (bactofilin family)
MTDFNGEYPTVIGPDAKFKGELAFDAGVRIEGHFDGQIKSKGTLHVAEGASVSANVEAMNVTVEGECKGNIVVSEKLQLLATARMEGDLRVNRLEIADGAIFVGNVVVGQAAAEQPTRRASPQGSRAPQQAAAPHDLDKAQPQPRPQPRPASQPAGVPRPRPEDARTHPTGKP